MNKKNILIVDDSSMMRNVIKKELNNIEFNIAEAANGEEALKKIRDGFIPDLITMDKDMPVMDGFETSGILRTLKYSQYFGKFKSNKVPIVFVTSSETVEDRVKGYNLGAVDFITKPFIEGELYDRISHILFPHKSLEGITILIVDDSLAARMALSQPLSSEGINVIEADDGITAYETICNRMSEIDLVITDLLMPNMDGLELCRKIRKELWLKDMPVIFLTGTDQLHRILEIFKAGGTDYLAKPFVKEEMLARILVHLDKMKLNKKLRNTVLELQKNLELNDEFTAMLTHDMKTPLNGIIGFAELLQIGGNIPEEEEESVMLIKKSGETLLNLINDILDLSKIRDEKKKSEFQKIFINQIARQSIKAVSSLAEIKEQSIVYKKEAAQYCIKGNSASMLRAVNNLLGNAVKFSPRGSEIEVSLEDGQEKGNVVLKIRDYGIGIPEERLPYLFDKFSRLSREGTEGESSTGLGMSIVKEVVEAHDGEIEVDSTPGAGSTFSIILPVVTDQSEAASAKKDDSKAELKSDFSQYHILIVEDNPVNKLIISKILEKYGCHTETANNGQEALQILDKAPEKYSLIFMDRHMPVMDGLEAARQIRERSMPTPIIAMSANSSADDIRAFINAGMDAYLPKPISNSEVLTTLNKWLNQ